MSYMSFVLKDVYDYADSRGPDQTNLTLVRNSESEIVRLTSEIEKLDGLLHSHGRF